MELVYQYIEALQALIAAGADVRMVVKGCSVGVVSVEVVATCLEVGCVTSASPQQWYEFVSLATPFLVACADWPQALVSAGWWR